MERNAMGAFALPISAEKRLQLLIDAATDHAIFMLDPIGRVASWNSGAQRLKGYTEPEIIGQHFSRFYTDEDRASGEPERVLRLAVRHGKFENEGWRVRKDGARFWANVVIHAIRNEAGDVCGFAKITRDITERRQAQEALEQARAAFLQAQRMDAVGQLTGGIAHDFNNLLTVIISSIDLLLMPSADAERSRRLLSAARDAAERGAKLTHQLLAFAGRQPLRPSKHDVNALLTDCAPALREAAAEGVEVGFDLAAGLPAVDIDVPQFRGALLNLVTNARDAMPNGGKLTITTAIAEIRSGILRDRFGPHPEPLVAIAVRDTGEGMSPGTRARAFEPFFTTKAVGKGSGLGLSQVHGFAAQSGGHVTICSQIGAGTTVTLYLPLAPQPKVTDDAVPRQIISRPSSRETVLVVEDEPALLELATEMLRDLGYEVLAAPDGVSALEILRSRQRVDVLFSDVVMPKGLTGADLAREARRLRPQLRVLLASGYPMAALPAEGRPETGFTFVSKPYRLKDLEELLTPNAG